MNTLDILILAAAVLLFSGAFLFSFWPLTSVAIALLVLYGHTASGVTAALIADLIFGAPVGLLGYFHFPFLLFALFCVALRQLSLRLVLERGGLDAI